MDDLRSEIRAAYQNEQAGSPPAPDLRRSIVRAVAAQPRRERQSLQWLAVAAALVIGVLVVVSLVSTRIAKQGVPGHVRPAPVGDYGPPPAGVPLFYLRDSDHAGWYVGFDWSGKPRATVKVNQALGLDGRLVQSPDGSMFMISPNGKGDYGQLLDRLGHPIPGSGGIWADDSTHTCAISLDEQKYTWTLVTGGPNEGPRNVALIAQDTGLGQTDIRLLACSYTQDRAVAVRTSVAWPSEVWVVRLSDGQVLAHNTVNNNDRNFFVVVGSADGAVVAENSRASAEGAGATTQPTIVRRVSDWSVMATLDPSIGVLAFSADDSLALVTTARPAAGNGAHLGVIDLATGRIVWRYDGDMTFLGALTEPGRSAFAIMLTSDIARLDLPVSVVIVHADGTTTDLPAGYLRP